MSLRDRSIGGAAAFLEELWTPTPPGLILLWDLHSKQSRYLQSPTGAAAVQPGTPDVYTGVGLAHKDHGKHRRTPNDLVKAIPGFWADIDVNGGPDDKQGAAPDEDAAVELANVLAEPTILVDSGYGRQAWWLFDEPWVFETRGDQRLAAKASAQWQKLLREKADFGLDFTHDLARILRLPGTSNAKGTERRSVGVIATGPRHERDELLEICGHAGDVDPGYRIGQSHHPQVSCRPDTGLGKLDDLIAHSPKFRRTWNHDRDDLPSMSEHDMALASIAALAGWSDQEIADLVCVHRRTNNPADPKATREDYVRRTVQRSRLQNEPEPEPPKAASSKGGSLDPEGWGELILDRLEAADDYTIPLPFKRLTEVSDGGLRPGEVCLVAGFTSHGKALDVATPVATPDGWKSMGELEAGDLVPGPDGRWVRVLSTSPVWVGNDCYRVRFSDGASIVADAEHRWTVMVHAARTGRHRIAIGAQTTVEHGPRIVTTEQLARLAATEPRPVALPVAAPIPWPERDLPIGPYTLGAWLGDGDSRNPILTAHMDDAGHLAARIIAEDDGFSEVRVRSQHGKPHVHRLSVLRDRSTCRRGHVGEIDRYCHCLACRRKGGRDLPVRRTFRDRLNDLGLILNKHIPAVYMTASPSQRLALLQGLMDTDGSVSGGRCEISLSVRELAEQVYWLVCSFGIKAQIETRKTTHKDSHRISFSTGLPVFSLPRKAARMPEHNARAEYRYVRAVEPVESRPTRCIVVDHRSGLFCAGHEHVVTHNSVVVDQIADTAAAEGRRVHLYLTEMTAYERGLRLLARRANVPFKHLRRRELDQHWPAILAELQLMPYGCSIVADWTIEDVVGHIITNRWDLVVVDLIHGFHYTDERELSKTSSAIVRAAKASAGPDFAGTTIVCAAHLNDGQMRDQRSPKRPRPGLHSIKGSSSLKQDADMVMFVWRQDDDDGIPEPDGAIWIAKARQGALGGVQVTLDPARMEFVERSTSVEAVA